MTIIYAFPSGFRINDKFVSWGDDRASIRTRLNQLHKAKDHIVEMAEFFDGDSSHDIEVRKDVYQDILGGTNYFFLMYDQKDALIELEVHWGVPIQIDELQLIFDQDIQGYLDALSANDHSFREIEAGNYLFQSLKMVLATDESLGGEGNGLSYFYAAKSIDHLLEE